jgi:hypothetical protein
MSESDASTVALKAEEVELLNAIRGQAPRFRVPRRRAETYAVWTICYRRYCQKAGLPWPWMTSVSNFMDFLDDHPAVSSEERDRALDGIMFYLTDVRPAEQETESAGDEAGEEAGDEASDRSVPRSTRSLFAQLLVRSDLRLTEAVRLQASDLRLNDKQVRVPGPDEPRTIDVPTALQQGLREHLERLEARTGASDPPLFAHRGIAPGPAEEGPAEEEPAEEEPAEEEPAEEGLADAGAGDAPRDEADTETMIVRGGQPALGTRADPDAGGPGAGGSENKGSETMGSETKGSETGGLETGGTDAEGAGEEAVPVDDLGLASSPDAPTRVMKAFGDARSDERSNAPGDQADGEANR